MAEYVRMSGQGKRLTNPHTTASRIIPMTMEAAMPIGMVHRRISPSLPTAPHMEAAMAILKGEEMEPMDAPTARPADSHAGEIPRSPAA